MMYIKLTDKEKSIRKSSIAVKLWMRLKTAARVDAGRERIQREDSPETRVRMRRDALRH